MTVAVTLAGGNKFVTLMCCSVLVVIVAILKQQLSNMHKILSVDSQENN